MFSSYSLKGAGALFLVLLYGFSLTLIGIIASKIKFDSLLFGVKVHFSKATLILGLYVRSCGRIVNSILPQLTPK